MKWYDYSEYYLLFAPYYLLFIFMVLLSFVFDFHKFSETSKHALHGLLVVVLSLFAGTRVGWSDQDGYKEIFDMVPPLPAFLAGEYYVQFRIEYFYLLLNSFLKCFSTHPLILFLSVAAIVVTMNLWAYRKYSPYFVLSVVAYYSNYFYPGTMTAMRQGLAAGIVLCGMSFLVDNDKKTAWFLLAVGIATLFHFSAIFALFGFLLYRLNFSSRILFILVIGAFLSGLYSPLSHWLFSKFMGLGDLNPQISTGLHYLEDEAQGFALGVLRPTSLKQLGICLLAIRYRDYLAKQLTYYNVLFVFYCAATMWRFMFNDVAVIAARVGGLLSVGEPVIIASFLLLFKPTQRGWVALCIFVLAAFSLYLNFIAFNFPPYVSALFGGKYWVQGYFGI